MTFTNKLNTLLNKASDRLDSTLHHSAPPIPYASKPPSQPAHSLDGAPHHPGPHPAPHKAYWHPLLSGPVSTHFRHELGAHGWGNAEAQNYTSAESNSFFSAPSFAPDPRLNALHIHAIAQASHPDPAQRYTSARLTSHQLLARDRGVLGARIVAPVAKGVWPAFWLLPADPFVWPGEGEVDVFEAWDGSVTNHSCLHWGQFNGEDWDKHRVVETELGRGIRARGQAGEGPKFQHGGGWQERLGGRGGEEGTGEGVLFEFAWVEEGGKGRMVWYIDGRPVMKASKPKGMRPLREFRILINIAMGGNVCKGRLPDDGTYEMVVRDLAMWESREGGWEGFERDWKEAREGHP